MVTERIQTFHTMGVVQDLKKHRGLLFIPTEYLKKQGCLIRHSTTNIISKWFEPREPTSPKSGKLSGKFTYTCIWHKLAFFVWLNYLHSIYTDKTRVPSLFGTQCSFYPLIEFKWRYCGIYSLQAELFLNWQISNIETLIQVFSDNGDDNYCARGIHHISGRLYQG